MPDGRFHTGRHAGVLVPLFSIPSRRSWGVGEIPDLSAFARWASRAGLDFVQLLPVNEMEEGQSSPYSAMTAMAIDPLFIAPCAVPELAEAGGESTLEREDRERLARARDARTVDYRIVRAIKIRALRRSFDVFVARQRGTGSARDAAFTRFLDRERWWLDDYALFRALHDEHGGRYWRDWEAGVSRRDPAALDAARARLSPRISYYAYLQWLADEQWQQARRDCGKVGVFGDFPFMVNGHSADVWVRQNEFRIDASVGVPPDAFSETGQDWGLPACRWDVMAAGGHEWFRQRARRYAALHDAFRIDHLVGFYRTFVRERDGRTAFVPPDEASQRLQGEALMRIFNSCGARIVAEDLGVVPDFVRESLAELRIPGFRVLRWEREWRQDGQPFRDPAAYPPDSVATSGTHDTDPLADWWDGADADERARCAELPELQAAGVGGDAPFSPAVRDAVLSTLFGSGSDLVVLPIQDVFGWRDRINRPAVTSDDNWTWRLPWPVEDLLEEPEATERAEFLRALARRTGRGTG